MKKLVLLFASTLCLTYAFSQTVGNHFTVNDVAISRDINGNLTVTWLEDYNTGGCLIYMQDERIDIRAAGDHWRNVYHAPIGGNPYYSYSTSNSSSQSTSTAKPPHGVSRYVTVTLSGLPYWMVAGAYEVSFSGKWNEYSQNCNVSTQIIIGKSYHALDAPPTGLAANVDDYCNGTTVWWNQLAAGHVEIHRDNVYQSSTTGNSWTDWVGVPGQSYNYKARVRLDWPHRGGSHYGAFTAPVLGRRFGPAGDPQNLFLDQVNCNGAIEVNWSWSASTNPDRFAIQRADDANFTSGVVNFTTSGSDRSYRDLTANVGQNYYYRVYSQMDCPEGGVINNHNPPVDSEAGLGIPSAPGNVSLTVDTIGKNITVHWSDNSTMEDGFKVVRQSSTGQVEFDVAENATSYTDNSAQTCETYTYSIKSYNTCKTTGVLSTGPTGSASAYIPTDLGTVFDGSSQKIEATDGEFGDRIDLKWNTSNRQIDFWNIDRINPRTDDTVRIASVNGRISVYSDLTANANTLYEYLIQGETDCAGNTEFSNTSSDHGFRLSFGTVNGQVTYDGGVAVEGVKISADPASGSFGSSMNFPVAPTFMQRASLRVPADTSFNSNEISIQAFLKPANLNGQKPILSRLDFMSVGGGFGGPTTYTPNGYSLFLEGNQLKLRLGVHLYSATHADIQANNWFSVSAVVKDDSIKLFVNKNMILAQAKASNIHPLPLSSSTDLTIGFHKIDDDIANVHNHPSFEGNLEEVRLFNRALSTTEVLRTNDIFINPSMNGLKGYWRFDAGFGQTAYDYSKTLATPNKNHATISRGVWSNDIPTPTQLSAGAYTNQLGSYFIPFIPYVGSGDNYTLTPTFGVHQFSPASTTVLIGTGSTNYTGQDFTDISSFTVTGQVKYQNTSCFVKEARLLIDGNVVIKNGNVVQTDANGQFSIEVPIGPHVVTVEKTNHDFSAGRFPPTGAYDFQDAVSGIEFVDSTLIQVVGRVAGGSIQKSLPPSLGRGKNNIGRTGVPFKAQQGNGCLVDTALTDPSTGEYAIELPPMRYEVTNFNIPSNLGIQFNNNSLLDISVVPPIQYATDSVFRDSLGILKFDRIDSAEYQRQRDFIYYKSPEINVTAKEVPNQYGSDSVTYTNAGVSTDIPTAALGLPHPVFEENDEYTWLISAFEIYENRDQSNPGVLDSVPMAEGNILIQNNLAKEVRTEFEYAITDTTEFTGIQEYTFIAGQANTSVDGNDPNLSYTKTCEVTLLPDNGNAVDWRPRPGNNLFRGIVFGGRALGNSFATQGPQVVTMILRDPPGTGSSSSWEAGEEVTTSYSFGVEAGLASSLTSKVSLGTEFEVGLGYTTPTKINVSNTNKINKEVGIGVNGELVETTSNSVGISTGGGDEFVGADADLFFGRSMNMDFGLSQVLSLVDASQCTDNCSGNVMTYNGKNYRIGTTISMFAIPKGYETEFVFTQAGIENSTIPKLEALRNQLLFNHPDYTSHLSASHPNFGASNDNPVFGANATPDDLNNAIVDGTGSSYTYSGYRTFDTTYTGPFGQQVTKRVTLGVDSVWWYNRQIQLWEDALAENEKAKVTANAADLDRNISYQGGSSLTYSTSTSRSLSGSVTLNFSLSTEATLAVGAEVGGAGAEIESSTSLSLSTNATVGGGTTTSSSFSYTLDDSDGDDEFSVDVFKASDGFGPIFKTRGGQTSCPYQGETVTKYYQPGTVLDKATIQLEQPRITAAPSNLFNVPANSAGIITLNLVNDGLEDAVYGLKVLEPTNPNGAVLKIDGIGPNRSFPVPAQTSITKLLSIEKGPTAIEYDSIALVFHSLCQFAFGTANYEDIADTVYVSVNFLPSCTEVELQAPQNQFIANNSFNNTLPIVISGYDINYGGLEKIQLQYKPSNQASWVPLPTEWFKDTVDIETRYPNHSDPQLIPRGQSYITYQLAMDQLIDQDYDLRAVSTCQIPFNPDHSEFSNVISGIFDRVNPHAFGSPSPADGVLDPNDDISIQFNEDIEAGSLTPDNFQITGVLNGGELRHDKAVNFDGANGFLEIANGFDFTSRDFTIEFWVKRRGLGTEQYLISQGNGSNNNFSLLFNTNNELELRAGNFSSSSSFTLTDTANWHHVSVSYDQGNLDLEMVDRFSSTSVVSTDNNYFHAYQSGGKTFVGKNAVNSSNFFDGSMHELRIWNRYLSNSQISSRIAIRLNGREAGLVGYWPMDDGRGPIARDISRFRHAQMFAEWELNPKSTTVGLDGISQYVSVDSAGTLAMTQEMDLTIEFWFKTNGGRLQTMLSNGSGRFESNDLNRNGWNIEMNAQNEIWVKNDSVAFRAVSTDFADNNWHHFALVVNRLANATAYIDGVQQNSTAATNFYGFSGAKLAIGARYYLNGVLENVDQHFNGNIDEVRVWNKALIRDNIELNMFNRLNGDEFGLQAYYPFEDYQLVLGVPILNPAMSNESQLGNLPMRLNASAKNGSLFSTESPAIALQRPVEKVNFSWSVNGDKIVITPNDPPARIENVTLNVSVKDVKDLHGNTMQSPKTWIAFVNKNQVLWQDQEKNLTKEFNDTMTFVSRVINSGGDVKNFTISNIPPWLSVSPSSGTIQPQSTQVIQFTVNRAINIGDYSVDLLLGTDFGFDEKLLVNLKVRKTPPSFPFDPQAFSKSMSVIGQISVNDIISTNEEDVLVAYVGTQVRGVAQLDYVPSLDRYIAFLDIFSNAVGDSISFKVWNSEKGELHEDVTPSLTFVENSVVGTLLAPQEFKAIDKVSKPIVLNKGWNWISFPLLDDGMRSVHTFFHNMSFSNGDVIKTIGNNAIATYGGPNLGWIGNLASDGLKNELSYLIHISDADTIEYKGLAIDPDTVPISVAQGWNRIGFVGLKNMDVNTALANFNATDGDLIKSQHAFAVYLNTLGWIGSLTALEPTEGYLLQAANADAFTFPRNALFRNSQEIKQDQFEKLYLNEFELRTADYEASTNAIVQLNTCIELLEDSSWGLAAFQNNELRGWSPAVQTIEEDSMPAYFITIYGEGEEEFDFALYNKMDGQRLGIQQKLKFSKNNLQGSARAPKQFELKVAEDCEKYQDITTELISVQDQTYPNPFTDRLTIVIPEGLSNQSRLEMIDQSGRIRYSALIGDQTRIHLNGAELYGFSTGVYQIKFIDTDKVITEKVVKIK